MSLNSSLTLILLLVTAPVLAAPHLVVHEWGTFTTLQDESGKSIGGINVQDEPLPKFVHELDHMLLINPNSGPPVFCQGAPAAHPDVTMRLETPVIYFHAGQHPVPDNINVHVEFKGGWLTQFYPNATAKIDGEQIGNLTARPLNDQSVGSLTWNNLQLGLDMKGPATNEHVWLAPRAVDAANITAPWGESEKFLFYRGVGHIDAPLQVVLENDGNHFLFIQDLQSIRPHGPLWLLSVRDDGQAAFRTFDHIPGTPPAAPIGRGDFAATDYAPDNIAKLRKELHAALVKDGLFEDEAEALLNTWQLSYFKSVGTRVFFLVPRSWTDHVLPLSISVPCDINRVMVARLELVGPRERDLLATIAKGAASKPQMPTTSPAVTASQPSPPDYQAYQHLGRFRDALLLDEQRRRPTEALAEFIANYGLHASSLRPEPATRPAAEQPN